MLYVMSDIHGEYERYLAMLEQIAFSQDDTLFVLGDAVDRGPEPIRLLQDMASRENVYLLKGNHEAMASYVLRRLNVEIAETNADSYIDAELMQAIMEWQQNGGSTTMKKFRELSADEKLDLLDYIDDAPLYDIVDADAKTFILLHSGLGNFVEGKRLSQYTFEELACMRPDFERRYYKDPSIYIVSGHTPTPAVTSKAEIYHSHNNILIDCGAAFGGKLACLCLNTMTEYYV